MEDKGDSGNFVKDNGDSGDFVLDKGDSGNFVVDDVVDSALVSRQGSRRDRELF